MCLKSAGNMTNSDNMMPSFPRSLSITKRLTILYAVWAFVLLAISAVFSDWVLTSDMTSEDNQFLVAQTRSIQALLQEHPDNMAIWKEKVEGETRSFASTFARYYVRIVDEKGGTLIETPGMTDIIGLSSFPAGSSIADGSGKGVKAKGRSGTPLLLMSTEVVPKPHQAKGKRFLVQMALDMAHEDIIISGYRKKVGIILLFGVLSSAAIGFAVAREGLRPLKAMEKAFLRIGSNQLNERVGSRKWPKEIGELAKAFDTMLDRLEGSFNSLSRFSADLAHELRNPINNLRGEAEVALYKTRTPDEYRQVIESSLEEFGKLSRMIENLLFLARAESRETMVRKMHIDARKEIELVFEYYSVAAEEKGIDVVFKGGGTLNVDPLLFRQAIGNILANAFQYTPQGGGVAITVLETEDHWVQIDVSDTGIGIEEENIPKVFDRFYRTERARSEYPRGTGLGFSIVKSIMDLHGGSVSVKSGPSEGTTVTLRFLQPPSAANLL